MAMGFAVVISALLVLWFIPAHSFHGVVPRPTAAVASSRMFGYLRRNDPSPRFERSTILYNSLGGLPYGVAGIATAIGLPSVAMAASKAPPSGARLAIPVSKGATRGWISILRRIVLGSTAKGVMQHTRAGDSPSEMLGLLLSLRSLFGVLLVSSLGVALLSYDGVFGRSKVSKELLREQQYRERMFIDAVSEILTKLKDPKLKASVKADLAKQVKELDPHGKIRAHVESNATVHPDLSDYIGKPKPKSNPKPKTGTASRQPELKGRAQSPSKLTEQKIDTASQEPNRGNGNAAGAAAPKLGKDSAGFDRQSAREVAKVLGALEKSLEDDDAMPFERREMLVELLQRKLVDIQDPDRRSATLAKIAQKIGDSDYWLAYANNQL